MSRSERPDFILIGAPKAGTTALHSALRLHPEVFTTTPKEPKYWLCGDAPPPRWSGPGDAHSQQEWVWRRRDYEALFRPAADRQLRGAPPHRRAPARREARRAGPGPDRPRVQQLDAPVVGRPRERSRLRARLRAPGTA